MIFETHAHYEDSRFEEDREELLAEMPQQGIDYVVNVGSSMKTSMETLEMTKKYDYIYGAVGVHPDHVPELTEDDMKMLADWCKEPKIVALGEIGLDYYYEDPVREVQKEWFARQLAVAYQEKMPIIVHSRDAAQDTYDILKAHHSGEHGGVIHCFGYSKEMAKQFIDMGFYIGVGGVVTFKNAKRLVEVVEAIDLKHIVLETDCPYMAPAPHRGKRNSSLYIPHIAEKIAEIKGVSVEQVYEQTMENAKKMYRILL